MLSSKSFEEMFISGTRISVEGLQIVFQDPAERQELCIGLLCVSKESFGGMCFHLATSRSRKIEFRGTEVRADGEMSILAGGEGAVVPCEAAAGAAFAQSLAHPAGAHAIGEEDGAGDLLCERHQCEAPTYERLGFDEDQQQHEPLQRLEEGDHRVGGEDSAHRKGAPALYGCRKG